jgi:hypothetical protein
LTDLQPLVWLLLTLAPLLLSQRFLHREIQAVLLILTRRADLTIALFSLIFFPGVLLHETSHWVAAKLLGVRTGRFSIFPRPMGKGRLQMGYVETAETDWFRDSLIGAAPLITGGLFVAYAGIARLGVGQSWIQTIPRDLAATVQAILATYSQPDFWLWFYLIFAVSSMMFPSASDRRAWLPIVLIIGALGVIIFLAGLGTWVIQNLAGVLEAIVQMVTVIFLISGIVHIILLVPVWCARMLLSRVTGLKVI